MFLIIDHDKNSVVVDDEIYKQIIDLHLVDISKAKRGTTMKELDKEVRKFLKESNKKEGN